MSPSTSGPPDRRRPDELRFCLDAQISYRVARALAEVELPFLHVSDIPGFGDDRPGRAPVEDQAIARWCGATGYVLVTVDSDFRGRWVRSGLLAAHDVEVIVFLHDLVGLAEQHRRITACHPVWVANLTALPAGHRVWEQGDRSLQERRSKTR